MLRYNKNTKFTYTNLQNMKHDFIYFLTCINFYKETTDVPSVIKGYNLFLDDIELALLLIEELITGKRLPKNKYTDTISYISALYSMLQNTFYDINIIKNNHSA